MMAFARVAKTADIPPGTIRELALGGKTIALANVAGKFHAMDGVCVHQGGPLGEGALDGCTVICPWHAWEYDVSTGKLVGNPDVSVEVYPAEVRGDEIFVDLG
jgi:nitrite reductase (NADH) small subunit